MNQSPLERLLEKYYEGSLTPPERDRLQELLSGEDITEEYYPDRDLILFDDQGMTPDPLPGFEERIMAAIDESDREKKFTGIRKRIWAVTTVAASVIIFLASYLLLSGSNEPADTFSDPLVAYNETVKALYTVSSRMNNGYDNLGKLEYFDNALSEMEVIGETTSRAGEELGKIRYIGKGMDAIDLITGSKNNK